MVQTNIIKRCRRRKRRDVPAIFAADLVALHNRCHCVPTVDRTNAPFHLGIAGDVDFIVRIDGVLVRRRCRKWQLGTVGAGLLYRFVEQVMRAIRAIPQDYVFNRVLPFLGFDRVNIVRAVFHIPSSLRQVKSTCSLSLNQFSKSQVHSTLTPFNTMGSLAAASLRHILHAPDAWQIGLALNNIYA